MNEAGEEVRADELDYDQDEDNSSAYLEKYCVEDTDCVDYPSYECQMNPNESKGYCRHKGMFPLLGLELIGLVILGLIMMMATVAGIGGGGVVIPICMTFFVF